MQRKIISTEDGSHSLYVSEMDEHFHSVHGAIQESTHVFIQNGLFKCNKKKIIVLEVGFGTGLNALLTMLNREGREIHYFSIEKYPLHEQEYGQLNYPELISGNTKPIFMQMHRCQWNKTEEIVSGFKLTKLEADFPDFDFESLPPFNLIYFDAFAPRKQPEMWQEKIFLKLARHTLPEGRFVTYCAQGEIRRMLIRCGFNMQRIPGPPGKKEMLTGEKIY